MTMPMATRCSLPLINQVDIAGLDPWLLRTAAASEPVTIAHDPSPPAITDWTACEAAVGHLDWPLTFGTHQGGLMIRNESGIHDAPLMILCRRLASTARSSDLAAVLSAESPSRCRRCR